MEVLEDAAGLKRDHFSKKSLLSILSHKQHFVD